MIFRGGFFSRIGSHWQSCLVAVALLMPVVFPNPASGQTLENFIDTAGPLLKAERYNEVVALADKAIVQLRKRGAANSEDHAYFLFIRGKALVGAGRTTQAATDFVKAIDLLRKSQRPGKDPQIIHDIEYELALAYRTQRRDDDATRLLTQIVTSADRDRDAVEATTRVAALSELAEIENKRGRADGALSRLAQAIALVESTDGPMSPRLVPLLYSSGKIATLNNRLQDAERYLTRSRLIAGTVASTDPDAAFLRTYALAVVYFIQKRYADGKGLFDELIADAARRQGETSPEALTTYCNIVIVYLDVGRPDGVVPLLPAMLKALPYAKTGDDSENVADRLAEVSSRLIDFGYYEEASEFLKFSVAIAERGKQSATLARYLNLLALSYKADGRLTEAEQIYRRALKLLGNDTLGVSAVWNNLGSVYREQGNFSASERSYRQALELLGKIKDPGARPRDTYLANLGTVLMLQRKTNEAELQLKAALNLHGSRPEHNDAGIYEVLLPLTAIALAQGKNDEAADYARRAILNRETARGPSDPELIPIFDYLSIALRRSDDVPGALTAIRRATGILIDRAQRATLQTVAGGTLKGEYNSSFGSHISLNYSASEKGLEERRQLTDEAFQLAQRLLASSTASAVQQAAARNLAGELKDDQVRKRQDAFVRMDALDQGLSVELAAPSSPQGERRKELLRQEMASIRSNVDRLDEEIQRAFPNYWDLVGRGPLTIERTSSLLKENEALVLIASTIADGTFVWLITANDSRWIRADIDESDLEKKVNTIRCGLDSSGWRAGRAQLCQALTGTSYNLGRFEQGAPLPFALAAAHELYAKLLGPLAGLMAGKRLIAVTDGILSRLPLSVLVTKPPPVPVTDDPEILRASPWVISETAVAHLPAVTSLQALRAASDGGKSRAAPGGYFGVGNPVLAGTTGCMSAPIPERCPAEMAMSRGGDRRNYAQFRGSAPSAGNTKASIYRNGLANVSAIREMCPLPESEYELRCVARSLNLPSSAILVGKDAREIKVKNAPLEQYSILHFATHGLLSNETARIGKGLSEPALVLTPPDEPTTDDDGLLTASEIARLRLKADWVVLSACNTAGEGGNEDPLSGLTKAFFFAGARALLVTHWEVDSYAASMIIATTFSELQANSELGRAEALRRAIVTVMNDRDISAGHPSIWAPFVLVGEGTTQ